ncbi:keratin, type I cytoskeletal 9 isoform X2 [Channa argus]|uniref:keratin, type I cytoskeletal 9 isoform X2 n=1 Tax=Channa argus TaxID=215402 RepID=UPI0035209B23
MLVRALLQTSLVLWLAQQTLQGGVGVKPQSVSWGRVLPARGVGPIIGVKPGVAGALGALGSRYGSKAMKTGIGRYPAAQLGVGGYRALGLGGRTGLKQGGYATPGAHGASLGTGMALGTGLTNGLGLGLGHGGKHVYGAGLGTLPGYGALAGIGYHGTQPGVSAADFGGPELASLGQAVQDLKREKSRELGFLYGNRDRTLKPQVPMERGISSGPSTSELQAGVKHLDQLVNSSSLGSTVPLDVSHVQGRKSFEPKVLKRKSIVDNGATLTAGHVIGQLPLIKDNIRTMTSASSQMQSAIQQNVQAPNCACTTDLSDVLEINRQELLGSETQRTQSFGSHPHLNKDNKHLGCNTLQAKGEKPYSLTHSNTQDFRSHTSSLPRGSRNYLSTVADRQVVKNLGLVAKDRNRFRFRGTVVVEKHSHDSLNLNLQGRRSYEPHFAVASGTQGLGISSVERQGAKGFTADDDEAKHYLHTEHGVIEPKALSIPGQTGRNNQATSYIGGAGNYPGASLGTGAYGPGLGRGAYLGGAAGKHGAAALGQGGYPQSAAGISNGYGEGATGYLGAVAGNGFGGDTGGKTLSTGYGNGYGDGYEAALSNGGYAGQVQGALGALGTGVESTGGKYVGGAGQVPYGNAPMIPGLEGAGARYGPQQTGYGAQLGAAQDILGEQAGKYGVETSALGNGYKG